MRADKACPFCAAPTRHAVHVLGFDVWLNPTARVGGRYGVVRWIDTDDVSRSIPVVAPNPTKAETPYRYDPHRCPA